MNNRRMFAMMVAEESRLTDEIVEKELSASVLFGSLVKAKERESVKRNPKLKPWVRQGVAILPLPIIEQLKAEALAPHQGRLTALKTRRSRITALKHRFLSQCRPKSGNVEAIYRDIWAASFTYQGLHAEQYAFDAAEREADVVRGFGIPARVDRIQHTSVLGLPVGPVSFNIVVNVEDAYTDLALLTCLEAKNRS